MSRMYFGLKVTGDGSKSIVRVCVDLKEPSVSFSVQ